MMRTVFVLLFATLVLVSPFFVLPRVVKVNKVICKNQITDCSDNITQDLQAVKSKSIKDAKNLAESKLSKNYLVKDHSLHFQVPGTLQVFVIETKPSFAVQNSGIFALLDEGGRIISIVEDTNMPALLVSNNLPNVGEVVDTETLFAANLVSRISFAYTINQSALSGNRLVIGLKDNPKVVFPLVGDEDVLLGSMTLILSRLKQDEGDFRIEETRRVKEVDLRFKNPVLR